MIKFDKVSKRFGEGRFALEDLNFEIPEGQFVFITGRSGAGKTTLFRLLRREMEPTEGAIFYRDWEVTKLKDKMIPNLRRRIAAVFQDFKLLNDRTLLENVSLPLEVLGYPELQIREETLVVLEKVDLAGREDSFPLELSGGEIQRAAVARAIVMKPEVLLADEPTGELDPENTIAVIKLLEEINASGKTVLVATHDETVVNHFKKRVITLEGGKIIKDQKVGRYAFS